MTDAELAATRHVLTVVAADLPVQPAIDAYDAGARVRAANLLCCPGGNCGRCAYCQSKAGGSPCWDDRTAVIKLSCALSDDGDSDDLREACQLLVETGRYGDSVLHFTAWGNTAEKAFDLVANPLIVRLTDWDL